MKHADNAQLARNQSGGNGENPWGQRGRRNAPPDLDEIFRQVRARIEAFLGGGRGRGGNGGGKLGGGLFGLGAIILIGVWMASGFYTVDQGAHAIELRFGKYSETTDAGLHWHYPRPIERRIEINTQQVNTVEVGYRKGASNLKPVPREALMLTQDENIIDIQFAVQYDIKSPTDLLFNVSEFSTRNMAETVVRQATESAVREIVGRNTMDFAITQGRAQLAAETKTLVQQILDRYQSGINIRTVEMQNAQPPSQVKNAFDDVVRAREDEERIINLAQAYENDIIPKARGAAVRVVEDAEAYKAATVAQAEGQASRFDQVLLEYAKAPEVTRDRLYLEAMEEVLGNSSKMIIDQQGGNSVMYLPLDQLLRNRNVSGALGDLGGATSDAAQTVSGAVRSSGRSNERTGRN